MCSTKHTGSIKTLNQNRILSVHTCTLLVGSLSSDNYFLVGVKGLYLYKTNLVYI